MQDPLFPPQLLEVRNAQNCYCHLSRKNLRGGSWFRDRNDRELGEIAIMNPCKLVSS